MTIRSDANVIGTGLAGLSLANRLNQEGLQTAIIERNLVGGTKVNAGPISTKTLVGSARVAHAVRQARREAASGRSPWLPPTPSTEHRRTPSLERWI